MLVMKTDNHGLGSLLGCIALSVSFLAVSNGTAWAADDELSNIKSGISLTFGVGDGSDRGSAYAEEYFYHDKMIVDRKVVYIRDTTPIRMTHNALNRAGDIRDGIGTVAGADQGVIRYRVDGDLLVGRYWNNFKGTNLWPACTAPIRFDSMTYVTGATVDGRTGNNGVPITNRLGHYEYGLPDSFGDEWHTITVADDDGAWLTINADWRVGDGKCFLFVVNPKTPCLTVRATGKGQFYTTPPKAYFIPKIQNQTTYFSAGTGTVTFELRDINGNNVHYRINGGSWVEAPNPILNQGSFADGTNTLEYYYTGNQAHTKVRTVVKNPTYPSAVEAHGDLLWKDEGFVRAAKRIHTSPNKEAYVAWRDSAFLNNRQPITADYRSGKRTGTVGALPNALAAAIEGWASRPAGSSLSYADYAKMAIMNYGRTMDSVGMEEPWYGPNPSREMNLRGYYDVDQHFDAIFAYDLLVAHFRADQQSGGVTPIEDYFVRDLLASYAFEQVQIASNIHGSLETLKGMWDTARRLGALAVMIGLPSYSTPYFGTSGWDGTTTTYPWAPFPDDRYTWKQALLDGKVPANGFPNLELRLGVEEYEFTPDGTFTGRIGYYDTPLMGHPFMIAANLAAMHGNLRFPGYDQSVIRAMKGTLSAVIYPEEGPQRFPNLLDYNSRSAALLTGLTPHYLQATPAALATEIQRCGVYGVVWYDNDFAKYTGVKPPPPVNFQKKP